MISSLLSFSSHSRPFRKLPVTFIELRPPLVPPSPPTPPKPPDPPDPRIRFLSGESYAQPSPSTFSSSFHAPTPVPTLDLLSLCTVRLFASMALFWESSGGLILTVECPITAVCRLFPSQSQIWGLMLVVSLLRFSRNFWPLLVDILPPFTNLSLSRIVPRSLVLVLMALPLGLLHPSFESFASDSLGVYSPMLTALCSVFCQIHFECTSLMFASDSLLLCLPFTKFSWSSRTEIKKDLTSYVRWKVEPYNLNPFIWESVMEFGVILAGVLILSDHLNGDSDLPCIEVFVRHVLILCVGKGFVPISSNCVYVFAVVKWEVQSLFRAEPPHLFFPKFPLDWSGLDDQASPVLQGSSSRLIVSFAFVAKFVIPRVAVDAVTHEAFGIVLFRSSLVLFVDLYLQSILNLSSFGVSSGTFCLVILFSPLIWVVIPPPLSEIET